MLPYTSEFIFEFLLHYLFLPEGDLFLNSYFSI